MFSVIYFFPLLIISSTLILFFPNSVADGYTNVIIELIKQGANVETTDSRGLTPIILAAASGDGECVATLLKDGKADGGAILTGGLTVLHMCAEMEEEDEAVNVMKNYGLQVNNLSQKQINEWNVLVESMYPLIRGNIVEKEIFDRVIKLKEKMPSKLK